MCRNREIGLYSPYNSDSTLICEKGKWVSGHNLCIWKIWSKQGNIVGFSFDLVLRDLVDPTKLCCNWYCVVTEKMSVKSVKEHNKWRLHGTCLIK